MSGGSFDYIQRRITEIVESIENTIEDNGKPIPEKDRWLEKDFYEK